MPGQEHEEVLRFWFPQQMGEDQAIVRQFEWWFRGGADAAIVERFKPLLEQAKGGGLDHWSKAPRSRLALIIVLDQFTRSIHRGTRDAYAQDPKAIGLALEGLEVGHYAALDTPWEKTFCILPLGHSEQLAHWTSRSSSPRTWRCRRPRTSASSWNIPPRKRGDTGM